MYPRRVFLLFYCRNLEKHIFLTCKCGVSPLDVSMHSCCYQMLPLLVVSRPFSTFTLFNSFFAQYRMSQKPKEETDVCRKWIKRRLGGWNAKVAQERKCWNRKKRKINEKKIKKKTWDNRTERKIVCSNSIVEKQTRSCF